MLLASASGLVPQRGELDLTVETPASLAPAADRVRHVDRQQLAEALARAGLNIPPQIHVTLIAEDDLRARATPVWIVGLASGPHDIAIFPERIGSYPYDSLESVVWHEVVHLALSAQAGDRPLPRWFHEGVAMSVEKGWGVTSQVQLLLAAGGNPDLADLERSVQFRDTTGDCQRVPPCRRAGVGPPATSWRGGAGSDRRPRRAWRGLRGGVHAGNGRNARRGCRARVASLPTLDELDSRRHQRLLAVDRHPGAGGCRLSGHAAQTVAAPAAMGSGWRRPTDVVGTLRNPLE